MTKREQIQNVIEKLFQDGRPHSTREIFAQCVEEGIDMISDTNAANNVVFKLKESGYLKKEKEKGVYVLAQQENSDEKEETSLPRLNWDKFFVLEPQGRRVQDMKMVIHPTGELRLNSHLQKHIQDRRIEIIMSKDYQSVLLNPQGANAHVFTKAGTARNRGIVELLKKAKIPLPASYLICWNEQYKMWEGKLEASDKS